MQNQNNGKLNWLMIPTLIFTVINTLVSWTFSSKELQQSIGNSILQVIIKAMNESIFVIFVTYFSFATLVLGLLGLLSHVSLTEKLVKNVAVWSLIEWSLFVLVKSILVFNTSTQSIITRLVCIALMISLGALFMLMLLSRIKLQKVKTWKVVKDNFGNYKVAYQCILIVICIILCFIILTIGIEFTGIPLLDWSSKVANQI